MPREDTTKVFDTLEVAEPQQSANLASREAERERFFALANRLTESPEPAEREKLKKELARMTFGA